MTRGRGRPPASDSVDTRGRILASARAHFAERGFAGASVRSIAAAVGVDPGLVRHYFGDKQQLLVASMELPIDPLARITEVLEHGPDGLGERLVRTFCSSWDPHRDVFAGLLRTAMTTDPAEVPAVQVAREVLVGGLAEVLDGDVLRAELVASMVVGLAALRYVVRLEPLASASVDEVVAAHGPAVQALVDGR